LAGAIGELAYGKKLPLLEKTRAMGAVVGEGYDLLASGNWAIYTSIYPTALAYTDPQGGIQAVRQMIPNPQDPLRQAWERLDAARASQNQDEIWAAAVDMVDYEQRRVLQPAIAGTPAQQQFWTSFSQEHGDRITAPYPGALNFKDVIPNGDYGNADQRMQWFQQELYPKAKQSLLDHPNGIDARTLLSGGYNQ
jgi:hypothetical protein